MKIFKIGGGKWGVVTVWLSAFMVTLPGRGQNVARTPGPGAGGKSNTAALIRQAARSDEMEIALTEIGARKARNQELKQYCLNLQHEQIASGEQLKPIAKQHGVSIDRPLTKRDLTELSRLQKQKEPNFDEQLATVLVREERQKLAKLKQATAPGSADDLRQYAQQMLPKAQERLTKAQAAEEALGTTPPGSPAPTVSGTGRPK